MRFVPARKHVALALVPIAFLAACSSAVVPGRTDDPVSPTRTSDPSPTVHPSVLDFEAASLSGGVLRGADYVGKDVALWFWAPW